MDVCHSERLGHAQKPPHQTSTVKIVA